MGRSLDTRLARFWTGSSMLHDKLALLRTLAIRPSRTVAQSLQPLLDELVKDGYVARDGDAGWMTTEKGCGFIENSRSATLATQRR